MTKTVRFVNKGLREEWFETIRKATARRMCERGSVEESENAEFTVTLAAAEIPEDGYRLTNAGSSLTVEASTEIGFFSGIGKFLRNSDFIPGSGFTPGRAGGLFTPAKPFRAMYYATHNYNFYHAAPKEEVFRYIEDSAFWGQNVLVVWYDMNHYTSVDSKESVEFIAFLKNILFHAKKVGMKIAFTSNANEAFFESEPELRATWWPQNGYFREITAHYHKEYCPSKPGGMEAILRDREAMLRAFSDVGIDYFITWPYDQGGCTCEKCVPWGSNGYLRIARALRPLIHKYFPDAKMCLSAWYFDLFTHGEWDAFYKEMKEGDYRDWISYIIVDFKPNELIPAFIRRDKSVAGIPILDFTEISMFSVSPWGGFGTNACPGRFSGIYERLGPMIAGGLPYSEGIHEDVNKIIMLGFFYGISDDVVEILREYCRFEFGPKEAENVVELLQLLETTHRRLFVRDEVRPEGRSPYRFVLTGRKNVEYIRDRAEEINGRLDETTKNSWRWRIIYLRALIDAELKANDWFVTDTCNEYFRELQKIYHTDARTAYCCAPPTPEVVFNAHGAPFKKQPSKYGI